MEDKEISKSLEILRKENIELINSKEYRLGKKIINFIQSIKKFDLLKYLYLEIKYRRISRFSITKQEDIEIDYEDYFHMNKDKKFVVYTCITGNYDILQEPLFKADNIDYIAFIESSNVKSDIWQVKDLPKRLKNLKNNILINRYLKFKPFEFFENYDFSLYIDGNIRVISDIRNMITKVNSKTGLAFHTHNSRNCIYKEAQVCKLEKKGNYQMIKKQINNYFNEGFPKNFGLYEANVILCDLKNSNSKIILNAWWDEFIKSKSYRDQICLPYVVWKLGYKFDDIGKLGNDVNKNPKFKKINHKNESGENE